MVHPPNELCGIPGLGLVPDQEIRRYIKDLGPAALKSAPTEAISIEHFWNSAFEAVQILTRSSELRSTLFSVNDKIGWRETSLDLDTERLIF
ncbi:hypothetical protein PoB_005535200 [Plakobranchus ocellatus]|uniref:Malate synthase n=1 Tax=Plakobranchus ocellatus TaxID=259542 RepID=A0AAV4CCB7_9GAST|nr:hypothetical protein PoB_005535200 [Plakobranchus ocellatus]